MKLTRVKIKDEQLDALKDKSELYKEGFFAGYVVGRENQLDYDRAIVSEVSNENKG